MGPRQGMVDLAGRALRIIEAEAHAAEAANVVLHIATLFRPTPAAFVQITEYAKIDTWKLFCKAFNTRGLDHERHS